MGIKLGELKAEARTLLRAGERGPALAAFDHILASNPLEYDSRLKIADLLAGLGDREGAASLYRALASHDMVIAPAEDGGYVLVGLSCPDPGIFSGVAWGGPAVMSETRRRLEGSGIRWKELETLWDIDRPDDYARLAREGLLPP